MHGAEVYPAKPTSHNLLVFAPRRPDDELRAVLDRFIARADREALVRDDPVELVRRYPNPHDQEVAGMFVAMLAYGRVASIKAKATEALRRLGPRPAESVDRGDVRALSGFVHRFQSGEDLVRFAGAVAELRRAHGSLGQAFLAATRPDDETYAEAMGRFVSGLTRAAGPRLTNGLRFLLPQPDGGGAAKRLCLYLRWMIRPEDGIDLGTWQVLAPGLEPKKLIIPLDTHIHRLGRYLGLTDRKTAILDTALDITRSLARLRPSDPLAYDIALCHLGISGRCPSRRHVELCAGCPIREVCRLGEEPEGWRATGGASAGPRRAPARSAKRAAKTASAKTPSKTRVTPRRPRTG